MNQAQRKSLISKGGERRIPNAYPSFESLKNSCVMARLNHVLPYVSRDQVVLDLGCGFGWQTKLVSLYCKQIVGLDVHGPTVGQAMELNGAANISWCVGSMEDLSAFDAHSFDLVISVAAVEHLTKAAMKRMFVEIHRVSKPGSLFVGTTTAFHKVGKVNATRWHLYEPGKDWGSVSGQFYRAEALENFKLDTPDIAKSKLEGYFRFRRCP